MSDELVQAAIDDTLLDIREWAKSLWEGGVPDTLSIRERMTTVLMLSLLAGSSTEEVRGKVEFIQPLKVERYQDVWWRIKGSPKVSRVFKEVIDLLLKKGPTLSVLSPKILSEQLRQTAWFISGVTSGKILEEIRDVLIRTRIAGGSQRDFFQQVSALSGQTSARLETVFRTNIQSATGAARWNQYNNPEVADLFFGYRYSSKEDGRARVLHRLMNGFVAVKDDSIWTIIWHPNGFNCRCTVRPLRRAQAVKVGLIGDDGKVINRRVFVNRFQRQLVELAERGGSIVIGGRRVTFPDEGFRGNSLIGLVA